jgi:hypothetical protein
MSHSLPGIERCLFSVRHDQARITREALAAHKTGRNVPFDYMLKHLAKNIAVTEPFVARIVPTTIMGRVFMLPRLFFDSDGKSECKGGAPYQGSPKSARHAFL